MKRHSDGMDVVVNTCYAIHFLSMTANNVSWMGAYGACEAVTTALINHYDKSPDAAKNACNAIGSLFKEFQALTYLAYHWQSIICIT